MTIANQAAAWFLLLDDVEDYAAEFAAGGFFETFTLTLYVCPSLTPTLYICPSLTLELIA